MDDYGCETLHKRKGVGLKTIKLKKVPSVDLVVTGCEVTEK